MAQHIGDGSLNIYTWSARDVNWQKNCGYDVHDAKATKEACREEHVDWDARLVAFTQEANDHVTPRDLYMLPVGHKWDHVRGVTLIGDSAHLMTPFAGEGVNLALQDSLKLSAAILSAAQQPPEQRHALLDKNVAGFEQDMFARATETQAMTEDMMQYMFKVPGSPRTTIERYVLRAIGGQLGYWTTLVATPFGSYINELKPIRCFRRLLTFPSFVSLVYTYFFFFKLFYR